MNRNRESRLTRSPLGIVTASVLLLVPLVASVLVFQNLHPGWWWAVAPIALALLPVGIYGMVQSVPRRYRDENGNPIHRKDHQS